MCAPWNNSACWTPAAPQFVLAPGGDGDADSDSADAASSSTYLHELPGLHDTSVASLDINSTRRSLLSVAGDGSICVVPLDSLAQLGGDCTFSEPGGWRGYTQGRWIDSATFVTVCPSIHTAPRGLCLMLLLLLLLPLPLVRLDRCIAAILVYAAHRWRCGEDCPALTHAALPSLMLPCAVLLHCAVMPPDGAAGWTAAVGHPAGAVPHR